MPRKPKGEMPITRQGALLVAQNVGRRHGYAVARHGTLIHDVDLIAVPWVSWAHPAGELVNAIAEALPGVVNRQDLARPHGRMAWTILPRWRYGDDHWFVDLSVMPLNASLPRRHKSERPGGAAKVTYRAGRPLHVLPPVRERK